MTRETRKTRPTILVADFDVEAASKLRDLLQSWNYSVELVGDGLAALQRLGEEGRPAIAILDYDLPTLSALEVVSELRHRSRANPLWIMLVCSAPDTERVLMANDAGVDDFLAKPIDPLELRTRLRAAERVQLLHYELHESSEAMRYFASHDHLTGLWNREALIGLLFQETDRVQRMHTPLSFLLLDLDGFSQFNIHHTYATGDAVLKRLASRFRRYLRSYDLIGRCGEDEFLIALPGCTPSDALSMAQRLQHDVLRPSFEVDSSSVSITASVGVAHSRGRSPLVVLREAERALADAKLNGRDCVCEFAAETQLKSTQETLLPGRDSSARVLGAGV